MDHRYIEEHLMADRYLLEKLSAEERAEFEEHFIDCAACLNRLAEAEDFRRALGAAAIEELTPPRSAGILERLAQLGWWRQAAIFAAVLLFFIGLPMAIQVKEIRRLRQELDQTRIASVPVLSPTSPPPSPTPSSTIPVDDPGRLTQPQINIPIITLSAVRRAESTPEQAIPLPASPGWMVISLELEGASEYRTYRATLSTADGRRLWKNDHLQPNPYGALTISFHSTFLPAGAYLLALEGLPPKGDPVAIANYSFRTIRKESLR